MVDSGKLAKTLLKVLLGKQAKTIGQISRLKAIKCFAADKDLLQQIVDGLVEKNELTKIDAPRPKYCIYEQPQPSLAEVFETRLATIEGKLDKILALLSSNNEALDLSAQELYLMVGKVDEEHNCHNLVPLPLLYGHCKNRVSIEQFHQLLLAMAAIERVDLQARSDRSSLSPDDLAIGIEDPYRGLLYYVGRKVS